MITFRQSSPSVLAISPTANQEYGLVRDLRALPHLSPLPDGASAIWNTTLRTDLWEKTLSSLLTTNDYLLSPSLRKRTKVLHEAFESTVYSLVILSVENNFAGLDSIPMGLVLRFLNNDASVRSRPPPYHRATPTHVSRTLAENLIRAAIEDCDATAVLEYLSTGLVNPDKIVCLIDGRRYTAVERAAMLRSYEVTEVLVKARTDVNATYEKDPRMEQGPLELAVRKWGKYIPVDMRLIDLFLDNGTRVRPGLVVAAIRWQDAKLVRRLFSKVSVSDDQFKVYLSRIIIQAVKLLDGELATMVVARSIQVHLRSGSVDGSVLEPQLLQQTLTVAAFMGRSWWPQMMTKLSLVRGLARKKGLYEHSLVAH